VIAYIAAELAFSREVPVIFVIKPIHHLTRPTQSFQQLDQTKGKQWHITGAGKNYFNG